MSPTLANAIVDLLLYTIIIIIFFGKCMFPLFHHYYLLSVIQNNAHADRISKITHGQVHINFI